MNLDDFSTVVDDRRYIKPQVALDESNTFIENLRNAQGQRTEEIAQDTYNLGTAVPSNLGGLSGAGSYLTSRYQTPQTNEIVANLKATAQSQALSDALNNAVNQAKERYNRAYKAYQRRNGANPTNPATQKTGGVDTENTTKKGNIWLDSARTDNSVTYGLYRLYRNNGESDEAWNERSSKWLAEQELKNRRRVGDGVDYETPIDITIPDKR